MIGRIYEYAPYTTSYARGENVMQVLGFLLCVIWGFNFVVMKWGNGAFAPVEFASLRFLVGTAVLLVILLWRRTPLPRRGDIKWFVLCGLLQTTYFNIAIQISLNHISAGLTSVLTYSMPLFLSLMAHFWIPGERLGLRRGSGIVIGLCGLFLAMGIGGSGGSIWAVLLGLSSAVAWALSNLIIKNKLANCDKTQFTAWQMGIGTLGLGAYSALLEPHHPHWSGASILYLLFAGIVASALAFLLWTNILARTEASKASVMLLLVPIFGVLSGWVFLHEQLHVNTLAGILLVLAGIFIVNRPLPFARRIAAAGGEK
ncbi:DMT family transporter [Saccharibacillus sp. CPCC 101409]|uniref:DMT family transporter n=1 Tax=Saccharibacillus sp. CPCC 101409 TaxID=3058041 RepID=UPI0026740A74|nr:DMT family transporter [Saccharibacillus sp. CPCC 101409]MDO3408897.1 DMT family transporter [Saccharibacillus sp. CPCC 101409]